jgi:hypothetical protein
LNKVYLSSLGNAERSLAQAVVWTGWGVAVNYRLGRAFKEIEHEVLLKGVIRRLDPAFAQRKRDYGKRIAENPSRWPQR